MNVRSFSQQKSIATGKNPTIAEYISAPLNLEEAALRQKPRREEAMVEFNETVNLQGVLNITLLRAC